MSLLDLRVGDLLTDANTGLCADVVEASPDAIYAHEFGLWLSPWPWWRYCTHPVRGWRYWAHRVRQFFCATP